VSASNCLKDAVILVGGKGTRLHGVVLDRPKPIADVDGRPFVEWLLISLCLQEIHRVVLCTGYMGDIIESCLGNGSRFGLELIYVRDPYPLGTGGALRYALDHIHSDCLLVLNGDSYCRANLGEFYGFHKSQHSQATILLTRVEDTARYGSVEVDTDGRVIAFREKASAEHSKWINAGVYLIERDIVELIPQKQAVSLEHEVFPSLIGRSLYAKVCKGLFWDIGTPESYELSSQVLHSEFADLEQLYKRKIKV